MKMISVLIVLAVFINLSKPVVLKLFMAYPTSEAKKKTPQSLTNNKRGGKSWILLIQGAYHQCNSIKRIPPPNKGEKKHQFH